MQPSRMEYGKPQPLGHGGRVNRGWVPSMYLPGHLRMGKPQGFGHGRIRLECDSRLAFPRTATTTSKLVADLFANCLDLGDQPPARNRQLTMLAGRQAHRKMEFLGSKRKVSN